MTVANLLGKAYPAKEIVFRFDVVIVRSRLMTIPSELFGASGCRYELLVIGKIFRCWADYADHDAQDRQRRQVRYKSQKDAAEYETSFHINRRALLQHRQCQTNGRLTLA